MVIKEKIIDEFYHGGHQTMFPCKKCKTMFSEESGAYKGFICEDCQNEIEDKKRKKKCAWCGKGTSGKYQIEGSTVCAKCYTKNVKDLQNEAWAYRRDAI